MTNLRQGRWPRWCPFPQSAFILTAAAAFGLELGAGLLVPGVAGAMVPTRNHRPLPTKLHTTSVSQAAAHAPGKHAGGAGATVVRTHASASHASASRAGGGRESGGAGSRASHASAAAANPHARGAGKRSSKKGGRQTDEDAAPVVPMFRARRGKAPLEHGAHSLPAKGRVIGRAKSRGKDRLLVAATPDVDVPERHAAAPELKVAHTTPAPSPVSRVAAPVHQEAFAQGVSRPDDDERLPRVRNAPEDDGETPDTVPAPVSRVMPAPAGTPSVPGPRTPVVQGFGGEIAVPSTAAQGTERPGGTRRRGHPSTWQPEALETQPEPLEEREAMLDAAVSPAVLPEVYDRGGRFLMPAPLRGSREVLVHQNVMALNDGLEKIYDDAALDRMRAAHRLVGFPVSESLRVNPDLPPNRRVARPWTVAFTTEMARAFYQRFHEPLQVNSAVRTVRYQAHLQLVNGNAAAVYGEAASPHLTGQAVDLAKRGMSQAELAWMRDTLLPLMRSGKIDVEEEFQQACFHISVYRSYAADRHTAQVAEVRASAAESTDR